MSITLGNGYLIGFAKVRHLYLTPTFKLVSANTDMFQFYFNGVASYTGTPSWGSLTRLSKDDSNYFKYYLAVNNSGFYFIKDHAAIQGSWFGSNTEVSIIANITYIMG